MKEIDLSIVIPVYNEEATVESLLERLEAVDFGDIAIEIVLVNDGSKDQTAEVLKKFEDRHKILHHGKNTGKGAAVRTGFGLASGHFVVVQDADLEYDPADIKKMVDFARQNQSRVVYGSRRLGEFKKKNPRAGWLFHLGGVFLTKLTNFLYRTKITDEPTCYKMVSREVLNKITLEANGFEFCPEITAKIARQKIEIHEVPISYNPRSVEEGKKIKFRDGLIAIWTLVKYRFIK